MRTTTLFNKLLNLQGLWVTGVTFEGEGDLILHARPRHRRVTCPSCGKSAPGTRAGRRRRWRHLAIWGRASWIEAEIRRFRCRRCERTVTESVPWARHDSDFTRPFEDAVGLMAQKTDKTAVSALFRISWVTVGRIASRLVDELLDPDRLSSLRRIGVDEISFRKRHRYLTVVSDHDTGNVVWVAEGKTSDVLKSFFELLPDETRGAIEVVTMDMSQAYQKAVREGLPNAAIAFDHFHIAKLANEALNEVRRQLVRDMKTVDPKAARALKGLRWATAYRLETLPEKHHDRLSLLRPAAPMGRAYLLKEDLLGVLRRPNAGQAIDGLKNWMSWATRCRLGPFVKLARTIRAHYEGIRAFLERKVSNARAEGLNNKIRLLSHRAFGFHSAKSLIATIYLCCGGVTVPAPLHLL